jgi:hypothetical protein
MSSMAAKFPALLAAIIVVVVCCKARAADPAEQGRRREHRSRSRKPWRLDGDAVRRFAFVIDDELVIARDLSADAWAAGRPRYDRDAEPEPDLIQMQRSVDMKKLPSEIARLAGTSVRLFDETGGKCEAKVGRFLLRARLFDNHDRGDDAPSRWQQASRFLVAKLEGYGEACVGATWARDSSLPEAPLAMATEAPPELRELALTAFGALPESRPIQRDFDDWARRQHNPTKGPWFRVNATTSVRVIRSINGPVLVSMVAFRGEGRWACNLGDDDSAIVEQLWALWEVTGPDEAPRLVLRNHPARWTGLKVTGAVDTDGDGRPELLFERFLPDVQPYGDRVDVPKGVVRAVDGAYGDIEGLETNVLSCNC